MSNEAPSRDSLFKRDLGNLGPMHPIDTGCSYFSDDIRQFFVGVNECAARLQAWKVTEIDARREPVTPKLLWKLLCLRQAVIYRTVELHNSIALLMNQDGMLGAVIMARTLVELAVLTSALVTDISHAIEKKDLQMVDNALTSTHFATRWEGVDRPKATNILTLLQKFDRDFMKDEQGKPVTSIHATLSEFCHPNWSGMAGFFGLIVKAEFTSHFASPTRRRADLLDYLAGAYVCLAVIERFVRNLSDFSEPMSELLLAADDRGE